MAGFKTHIGTSTVVGIGYGVTGYTLLGAPLATSMVAGGLCSVAGMLPDLDSDSGVPVRETMSFAAAIVPALMIPRFEQMGMTHEAIALAAGLIYIAIRFGMSEIFKRYTVHRGMWHSIPAMCTAGLIAYLLCSTGDFNLRVFKAGGVVLGFFTHLLLDEIWSVEFRYGLPRFKKSFGTALKLWSTNSWWANISTYGKLALLVLLVFGDPIVMQRYFPGQSPELPQTARRMVRDVVESNLTTASDFLNDTVRPQPDDISFPSSAGAMSDDVWRGETRTASGTMDELRR